MNATIPSAFQKRIFSILPDEMEVTQQQYVDFLNTLTFNQPGSAAQILNSSATGYQSGVSGGVCAMIAGCLNRNSIKLELQKHRSGR